MGNVFRIGGISDTLEERLKGMEDQIKILMKRTDVKQMKKVKKTRKKLLEEVTSVNIARFMKKQSSEIIPNKATSKPVWGSPTVSME